MFSFHLFSAAAFHTFSYFYSLQRKGQSTMLRFLLKKSINQFYLIRKSQCKRNHNVAKQNRMQIGPNQLSISHLLVKSPRLVIANGKENCLRLFLTVFTQDTEKRDIATRTLIFLIEDKTHLQMLIRTTKKSFLKNNAITFVNIHIFKVGNSSVFLCIFSH